MLFRDVLEILQGRSKSAFVNPRIFAIVYAPLLAGLAIWLTGTPIKAPASILTLLALLFGGYLSSFVHYSTLRLKLTEQESEYKYSQAAERKLVDSVATLLLFGAVTAALGATIVAISMTLSVSGTIVCGWTAGLSSTFALVPLLTFGFIFPKLHSGYKQFTSQPHPVRQY